MRPVTKIHCCLIFLMLNGFSLTSAAQDEEIPSGAAPVIPVPGYVLLLNGDTIYGTIRWSLKYVENNPVEVKFKAPDGEPVFYKASEIKGFGNQLKVWMEDDPKAFLMDMENYQSIPSFKKGVPVFMNRLLDGRITVFQNRSAFILSSATSIQEDTRMDGIEFTFSRDEGLTIGPSYRTDYRILKGRVRLSSYYVSKNGEAMFKIDKDNYDSVFKSMFGDCPEIDQELGKNPDLAKFKNFMILAEVYNKLCK